MVAPTRIYQIILHPLAVHRTDVGRRDQSAFPRRLRRCEDQCAPPVWILRMAAWDIGKARRSQVMPARAPRLLALQGHQRPTTYRAGKDVAPRPHVVYWLRAISQISHANVDKITSKMPTHDPDASGSRLLYYFRGAFPSKAARVVVLPICCMRPIWVHQVVLLRTR